MLDQAKHTRVKFQEFKEKYFEGITLHNQLVDEIDWLKKEMNQLKIEKIWLERTCNQQNNQLVCYQALFYKRGHDNSQIQFKITGITSWIQQKDGFEINEIP